MANQYLESVSGTAVPLYVTNGTGGSGTAQVLAGAGAVSPVNTVLVTSGAYEYTFAADTSGTTVAYALNGAAAAQLVASPTSSADYLQTAIGYVPFVTAAGGDDVAYFATYVASYGGLVNTLGAGWIVSNGTAGGTSVAVPGGSVLLPVPQTAAVSGNRVYVAGNDGTHGTQVWSDDGATAIRLDPTTSAAGSYALVGAITPFTTAAGVAGVAFIGSTAASGRQLYVSDGTTAGTRIIPTAGLTFASSTPPLYASGGKLYFEATDAAGRDEIWASDGTGIVRLDAAPASTAGTYALPANEQAFTTPAGTAALAFTAQPAGTPSGTRALYVTTGTAAADIQQVTIAGLTGYQTFGYAAPAGNLVFAATDAAGNRQLWATNGGTASRLDPGGTGQATYIGGFTGTSQPFAAAGGTGLVAFAGNVGTAVNPILQLFVSNGTGGTGTRELVVPGSALVASQTPVASGGYAYVLGTDAAGNRQAYATNGVTLARLDPGAGADTYSDAANLTTFTTAAGTAALAFTANAGTAAAPNYQLYVTDGTAAGTRSVSAGTLLLTKAPSGLTVNGSNVYFTASPGSTQLGFVYNGTGVSQITPGAATFPVQTFEAAQTYAVAARDAAKADAATGTTAYTFTITRSGALAVPAVLGWSVAGSGTAPAPSGLFAATAGTVSFAPGGSIAILTVTVNGVLLAADLGFTVTLGAGPGANGVVATDIQVAAASGTILHNTAVLPAPTPTGTLLTTVAALVAAEVPAGSLYSPAANAAAAAGLVKMAGSPGALVSVTASPAGPFAAAAAGLLNAAIASAPAAGSTVALPSGYGALLAQGGGAVTLGDGGAAGAVLVGNGAGDTFASSGAGVTLVGGNGADTFKVSGSAAVVTGTGGSTVTLGAGPSTVQCNAQDTVFGGAGADMVTVGKGSVAIGGTGLMTFIGGTATSVVFGGKGGLNFTGGSAFDIVVGVGGAVTAKAGSGGGEFFGNAGGDVLQAGTGQTIMVLNSGGKAVSTGAAGNFLVAGAGTAVLDGSAATGADVFFGGTGQDAILCGSGNDLVGTGNGTSTVQLGAGSDTVFAFGASTVLSGAGNGTVVMGGTVTLAIAAGAARSFALFNFVPGTDHIDLSGFTASTVANALATQVNGAGQTVLTLGDQSTIQLIGVARADAGFFA